MFKNFRDKIAISGIAVLLVGVALLVFTFVSAYGLLTQSLSIIASNDLVQTFGDALAPLIATCIRIMYLGVMGWVGSLLTIRGVTLIANTPKLEAPVPQKPVAPAQPQPQPQQQQKPMTAPQKTKVEPEKEKETKPEVKPEAKPEVKPETKPEAKPPEPQIIMIPPEEMTQPPPQQKEPEKTESPSPPSQ